MVTPAYLLLQNTPAYPLLQNTLAYLLLQNTHEYLLATRGPSADTKCLQLAEREQAKRANVRPSDCPFILSQDSIER